MKCLAFSIPHRIGRLQNVIHWLIWLDSLQHYKL
jgi:hypothetical protein